jgi:hypothetical protein
VAGLSGGGGLRLPFFQLLLCHELVVTCVLVRRRCLVIISVHERVCYRALLINKRLAVPHVCRLDAERLQKDTNVCVWADRNIQHTTTVV